MNCNLSPRVARHRGLSILELTVIIATLLTLTAVLFVGSRGWKQGSDRAGCVLVMRNVQLATRSYQNMYGYEPGGHPCLQGGTQDIGAHLFAKGYIEASVFDQAQGHSPCPGGGLYENAAKDTFPEIGTLYLRCSLEESEEHVPTGHEEW